MDKNTIQALFVYGSLAPNSSNAHILSRLSGSWTRAEVQGRLVRIESGPDRGYLALLPGKQCIKGWLFEHSRLNEYWPLLDQFEGNNYQRVEIQVQAHKRQVPAYIYMLSDRAKRLKLKQVDVTRRPVISR